VLEIQERFSEITAFEVPVYKLRKARSDEFRILGAVVLLRAAVCISRKTVCSPHFL
jgi:hypothetical protein